MKLKKFLSVSIAAFMVAAVVSGCGGSNSNKATSSNSSSGSTTEAEQSNSAESTVSKEVKEIIVTYLTTGNTPKDLDLIQDSVNKMTEKDIGVKVKFYPISAFDTVAKYGVLFASGEQIDLAMLLLTPMQGLATNGSLKSIDSLIESDGKDLKAFNDKYGIFGKFNDKIYSIMPVGGTGMQGTFLIKEDEFKKAGLEVKSGNYTYDDLTQVFAGIKKSNPKIYPCGLTGPNSTPTYTPFAFFNVVDRVGTYNSGVLMGTQSTKLVNMYETKEYYEFLKQAKKWYEAGYILPDAATNQTPLDSLIKSGAIAGYPMANAPTIISTTTANWGGAVSLTTTEKYNSSNFVTGGWAVPVTSKEPEAAIKFMNYLYTHDDLTNLIQWGVEGKHYKVTDKENGVIAFADGVDFKTSTYYNSLGLWGNQINAYAWNPLSSKKLISAFSDECALNPTKAVGFNYYNPELANTAIAVDTVLKQYLPALETGGVKNLDATYKEFITKLKAAGIDKLIADKQSKFDEWLAKR